MLIDTAGRFVAQDSNAPEDKDAWRTFLRLLKKHRPRQPINGVIATLSIQDLLKNTAAERQKLAQRIRIRLEELQHELGLRVPVYLMVTMSDLIAGFTEFFSTLNPEQRAQVWGASFEYDPVSRQTAPAKKSFDESFPQLVEKINGLMLQRLQEERDVDRRAAIHAFPQQFATVGPLVSEFVDIAFNESRYDEPVILRGIYFTSGTQFGAPIDRLIFGLTHALDLRGGTMRHAATVGAAKSYFIQRLTTDVIFAEAGLAGYSEMREVQLRRLSWGLIGATMLVGAGLLAAWTVSYVGNRQGLQQAAAAASDAARRLADVGPPGQDDLPVLVDALDAVAGIPNAVHDPVLEPRASMRWGLYQGRSVADSVGWHYRNALQQGLMPRVALQLEAKMADRNAAPEHVYAALKTYLMMYDHRHLEPGWFVDAVSELWRLRFGPGVAGQARQHLKMLVDTGDLQVERFHQRNDELVAMARNKVAGLPLVERALAVLRFTTATAEPRRLSEVLGAAGVAVFERASGAPLSTPIEPAFTAEGYRRSVKPRIREVAKAMSDEEAWVLGDRASGLGRGDNTQVAVELQKRYFAEYDRFWRATMSDLKLRKLEGLPGAQAAAQALGQGDSPLRRLATEVAEQTRLASGGVVEAAGKAVKDNVEKKLKETATNMGSGLFGQQSAQVINQAMPSDATKTLELTLENSFKDFRDLVGDGKSGRIDVAMVLINEVGIELLALQQKRASGLSVKEVPAKLSNARAQASTFPAPIAGVISSLVAVGENDAMDAVKSATGQGVGAASAYCRRAIPGKYPFNRNTSQDVGVQDFEAVFKAGAALDEFFATNIAPYVDKSGIDWRLKSTGAGSPAISQATLRQFQNAEAIRNAFLAGGTTARVIADVTVVSAPGEVQIEHGGTRHTIKPGASLRLNWPASPGAKLSIGGVPVVSVDGAWALFRLIDRGMLDASSSADRLRLSYTASDGSRATVEVRTGSTAFNPLRLRELDGFACP